MSNLEEKKKGGSDPTPANSRLSESVESASISQ